MASCMSSEPPKQGSLNPPPNEAFSTPFSYMKITALPLQQLVTQSDTFVPPIHPSIPTLNSVSLTCVSHTSHTSKHTYIVLE